MDLGELVEEEESQQVSRAYPNVDEIIRDDLQEMYQERRRDRGAHDDMDGAQIFTANEERAINFFRNSSIKMSAREGTGNSSASDDKFKQPQ